MTSVRWLLYATLIALPFGARKLLFQFTPGFHEYEAAFIYATDLFLAVFVTAALVHFFKNRSGDNFKFQISNFKAISKFKTHALLAFLLFVGISIFFAESYGLALYSFVRLLLAAAFAVASAYVVRHGLVQLRHIFGILAVSAVFQSLIAVAQFAKQGSIGLWFLGEPVLSATAPGIAKFTAEGGKILRAYGTFPHPNVLGAFLVVGLIGTLYLFLRHEKFQAPSTELQINSNQQDNKPQIVRLVIGIWHLFGIWILIFGIFATMVGLVLTFSRSAWLVAIIVSIALLLYCFARSELRRRALPLLFVLFAIGYSLFAIFPSLIFPRAHIAATEPSVVQRLEYNRLGIDLIAQHPFGVGIGNQVLYSVRNGWYEKFGMANAWQWEPIHNIYLLIASEVGVVGLVALLVFLATLLNPKSEARNPKQYQNSNVQNSKRFWIFDFSHLNLFRISNLEFSISVIMLFALLLFGLVDHFLWTLRPGQLMLWLSVGMLWGVSCGGEQKQEHTHV